VDPSQRSSSLALSSVAGERKLKASHAAGRMQRPEKRSQRQITGVTEATIPRGRQYQLLLPYSPAPKDATILTIFFVKSTTPVGIR
jgi:hypothetical protein